MSEPVWAWIEIGPWTDEMAESDTGKALRDAIDGDHGALYDTTDELLTSDDGIVTLRIAGIGNYDTAALTDTRYPDDPIPLQLATAAGLWCRYGDDGHCEWDSSETVIAPDGTITHVTERTETGTVVLSHGTFRHMKEHTDTAEALVAAIESYFERSNRPLAGFIAAGHQPAADNTPAEATR